MYTYSNYHHYSSQSNIPGKLLQHKKVFEKLTNINIDKLKFLDGGAQGQIFEISKTNYVLKFTNDVTEAKFCEFLRRKKSSRSYLPKIKFVYKIDKEYMICMEKLSRLPQSADRAQITSRGLFHPFSPDYLNYLAKTAKSQSKQANFCLSASRFFGFLKSLGVTQYDFHLGNIMVREPKKEFVFIDFGFLQGGRGFRTLRVPKILA